MSVPPLLVARGLAKRYGARRVLETIDLAVRPGELVALLGSSGAGKTTLIRCIAGLEHPDAGTIAYGPPGRPPRAGVDPAQLSLVFQDLNLIRRLPALDNVVAAFANALGPAELLFRWYGAATRRRAEAALAAVGLADHADVRADRLSGGQQQRVAIARALARRSRLVLADEPVASLDGATAREVLAALRRVGAETGCAILCSLHQVDLALAAADRVIGLADGRVQFDTVPAALDPAALAHLYGSHPEPRVGAAA